MKIYYIILFFLPILCNELVFELISVDNIENNIIDNLPEDSSEKESSENSEEEKKMEYFDIQNYSDLLSDNQKKLDKYPYLSIHSLYILDIHSPPPEKV